MKKLKNYILFYPIRIYNDKTSDISYTQQLTKVYFALKKKKKLHLNLNR